MPRIAHTLLVVAAIPILVMASWLSFRAAQADFLERRPSLAAAQRAVAITPDSARAHDNAAMLYAASNPLTVADAPEYRAAVALNPRDAAAWMSLGLQSEMSGDLPGAEQDLLRAASINHMFKPAWSLANFYFRTGQKEKFWPWARKCIELSEHRNGERWTIDPLPVFELCWNLSNDGRAIEKMVVPEDSWVLGSYVYYLITTSRLDDAMAAADRLYPIAQPREMDWLYQLCDTLIQKNRGADAIRVWNALSVHGMVPYHQLNPATGYSLTNGRFTAEPSRHGFDWTLPRPADIYERYSGSTHTLRFDINGDEPENCELMGQAIPLVPGRRYRLTSSYTATDLTGASGLHWSIVDSTAHKETASLPLAPGTGGETAQSGEFLAPKDTPLVHLALRYDRPAGSTRPKGSLKLNAVTLELLP